MFLRREKINSGFTLMELLVTISIFVILTGVVLFSQSKFNSSILLTNLAYNTALTIRQAQNYGVNVREFTGNDSGVFKPYGVHFDMDSPKSFILFTDLTYESNTQPGDGRYPLGNNECKIEDGCVERLSIKGGNYIFDLCVDSNNAGDGSCNVEKLDIVFKRPDPDARILINGDNNTDTDLKSDATIIFKGTDDSIRKVRVQKNGLIEIKNN